MIGLSHPNARPPGRFATIAGAYTVASVAAGLIMSTLYAVTVAVTAIGHNAWSIIMIVPVAVLLTTPFVIVLALVPSSAAIALGEWRGIRSPTYYGGMGALAGLLVILVVVGVLLMSEPAPLSTRAADWQQLVVLLGLGLLFALSGLGAGLTYWRLAGRSAGV
jgi:hypothetical protein